MISLAFEGTVIVVITTSQQRSLLIDTACNHQSTSGHIAVLELHLQKRHVSGYGGRLGDNLSQRVLGSLQVSLHDKSLVPGLREF